MKLVRGIVHPDGMRRFGSDTVPFAGGGVGGLSLLKISGDSGHLTTLHEGYPDGAVSVTANTAYVLEGQLRMPFRSEAQAPTKPFQAAAVDLTNP